MLVANLEKIAARVRELARNAAPTPIDRLQLLSPVANPSKIIGAPVNYRKGGEDEAAIATAMSVGLFLKANGSLAGPSEGIALKMMERQIDYEVELGVVIGKRGTNIRREDALTYVAAMPSRSTLRRTERGAQPSQIMRDLFCPRSLAGDR